MKPLALCLSVLVGFFQPVWAETDPFQNWQTPPQSPPLNSPPPLIQQQSQSVQVQSLADGRWRAQLRYQDQANDTRDYTFEGTPDEIRSQLQQSGLPQDKQQAVLQAMTMQPEAMFADMFGQGFPFSGSLFGGKGPFDHPFFKQNPFDDPFFKQDPFANGLLQRFFAEPPRGAVPAPVQPQPPKPTQPENRVWL
ncbi:MAG: hypothetical protein QJT81_17940 [Candidatus Thiothrix putei]|uniref:Uncharacterized protein n=1 Tax=Candidatus Thiothrix putei TaxID=3080811 RepID=A0AA95HAH3_9GAMM|nr:MAG: hypothetical protein QJT81_17940 [Candidatus Thiothrix putei]